MGVLLLGIEIMTIVHDVLLGFGFVLLWVAVVLVVFLSCFQGHIVILSIFRVALGRSSMARVPGYLLAL